MSALNNYESKGSNGELKEPDALYTTRSSDSNGVESGELKLHPDEGFDPAVIKKIRRKIDWRLVPPLAALYAMSLIDR